MRQLGSNVGLTSSTAQPGSPPQPPSGTPSVVPSMSGGGPQPFNFGIPAATPQAPTVGGGSGPQMFNIGGNQGTPQQAGGSPTGGMSAAVILCYPAGSHRQSLSWQTTDVRSQ